MVHLYTVKSIFGNSTGNLMSFTDRTLYIFYDSETESALTSKCSGQVEGFLLSHLLEGIVISFNIAIQWKLTKCFN